jgi:hypothetical protein
MLRQVVGVGTGGSRRDGQQCCDCDGPNDQLARGGDLRTRDEPKATKKWSSQGVGCAASREVS